MVRTTTITLETERLVIVHKGTTAPVWCVMCDAEVEVITLDALDLALSGAPPRIRDRLQTARLHCWHPSGEPSRVCLPSLLRCLELE
jgi:hypothetical protein